MIWCNAIPNTTKKSEKYKSLIAEGRWEDIENDIPMYCEVIEEYVESTRLGIPFTFKLPDTPKSIGVYNAVVRKLQATNMLIDVDEHNRRAIKAVGFSIEEEEQYNEGYVDGLSKGKIFLKKSLDKLMDNIIMYIAENSNPLEEEDLINYGTGYNDGLDTMLNYIVDMQLSLEESSP